MSGGRITAGQGDNPRFRFPVYLDPRWGLPFFPLQSGLKPFLNEAFTQFSDGPLPAAAGRAYPFIGPMLIGRDLVQGEQYMGVPYLEVIH